MTEQYKRMKKRLVSECSGIRRFSSSTIYGCEILCMKSLSLFIFSEETAIKNGTEVIFATTAPLIAACRKTAIRHPDVKILNCSISMPYTGVRTYYSRIYEGKFISGAIAGAVSKNDRIGYIASYPIFGVPAGINAFALGVQLTNPRARIELKWACVPGNPLEELKERGIDTVSALDIPMPGWEQGNWGTFRILADGKTELWPLLIGTGVSSM